MDTCGRGHHRARFDRRKNDERIRQQANKENIGVLQQPRCTDGPSLKVKKTAVRQYSGRSRILKRVVLNRCNRLMRAAKFLRPHPLPV